MSRINVGSKEELDRVTSIGPLSLTSLSSCIQTVLCCGRIRVLIGEVTCAKSARLGPVNIRIYLLLGYIAERSAS